MEVQEKGEPEVAGKPVTAWIEIANGGRYDPPVYRRLHWWQLRKVCVSEAAWEYDLAAQLHAIEVLGGSGSQVALDFLSALLISEISVSKDTSTGIVIGPDAYYYMTETVLFPNVLGPLHGHLAYSHTENEMNFCLWSDEEHQEARMKIKGHQVIRKATLQLLHELGNHREDTPNTGPQADGWGILRR